MKWVDLLEPKFCYWGSHLICPTLGVVTSTYKGCLNDLGAPIFIFFKGVLLLFLLLLSAHRKTFRSSSQHWRVWHRTWFQQGSLKEHVPFFFKSVGLKLLCSPSCCAVGTYIFLPAWPDPVWGCVSSNSSLAGLVPCLSGKSTSYFL